MPASSDINDSEQTLKQVLSKLLEFMRDIKIAHSVFALPFALSVLFIGSWQLPDGIGFLLIVLCMISARSFAMGANRYLDWSIDLENSRTAQRAIPAGRLTPKQAVFITVAWGASFVLFANFLSPLAGWLSVPVLLILGCYPLVKHFGWFVHWYLGLCLGLAPIAVAVALAMQLTPAIFLVSLAVMFWTAGFDILYAMQDLEFDRRKGLQSAPARFGVNSALWFSRISFAFAVFALFLVGYLAKMGVFYYLGITIIAAILAAEHFMLRDIDEKGHSKHTGVVFLNLNASVSIVFLVACILDGLVL